MHSVLTSCVLAALVGLIGGVLKYARTTWPDSTINNLTPSDEIYKGFTTLVTMMIVFHTAQSYARFMSGVTLAHQISADFLETASLLTAFCKASVGSAKDKNEFMHTMVRLFSMLFTSCLADLESNIQEREENLIEGGKYPRSHKFNMLDPGGLDRETLKAICGSSERSIAVNQRLIDLIMSAIQKQVLSCPPPILSRLFQELGMGMFRFHEALKFKETPFPVPYIVVADMLMIIHSLMTPFIMTAWADTIIGVVVFSFVPCFSLWSLHCVAEELDNPFAEGQINLDGQHMVDRFNHRMLAFLEHAGIGSPPELSEHASVLPCISLGDQGPREGYVTFGQFISTITDSIGQVMGDVGSRMCSVASAASGSGSVSKSWKSSPRTDDVDNAVVVSGGQVGVDISTAHQVDERHSVALELDRSSKYNLPSRSSGGIGKLELPLQNDLHELEHSNSTKVSDGLQHGSTSYHRDLGDVKAGFPVSEAELSQVERILAVEL